MKLFIDESGNTGQVLNANQQFNFHQQPVYVLAGIMLSPEKQTLTESFVLGLRTKYRIQADELKSSKIYSSKPGLINELVSFVIDNDIPWFIELMDKKFYLNTQMVEYFFGKGLPLNDQTIHIRRALATNISTSLTQDIYSRFIETCQNYTHEALESFYTLLIEHLDSIEDPLSEIVSMVQSEYFELKEQDPITALKSSLPLPDPNFNDKLQHLLPNYNAFTDLLGRAQLLKNFSGIKGLEIVHDEQKQFESIFKEAFEAMKLIDTDSVAEGTLIADLASYNLDADISLRFADSKEFPAIQVCDLLAGFIMRFWMDFIKNDSRAMQTYMQSAIKLTNPTSMRPTSGIMFVVGDDDHRRIVSLMNRT